MTTVQSNPGQALDQTPPSRLVSFFRSIAAWLGAPAFRLSAAWVITIAVLIYCWARAFTVSMVIGRPETHYGALFVVGLLAVCALTFRLGRAFPGRRAAWTIGLGVGLPWVIFNTAVVALYNGERLATPVLAAFFVPATLWVAWAAWMFSWPLSWLTRFGVLTLLLGLSIGARLSLRIDGWSGDARPNFTLAWMKTAREFHQNEVLSVTPAFPVDLTRTTDHDFPQFLGPQRLGVLPEAKLARDWNRNPPRLVWRQPVGEGWSGFAVVGDFAITQEQRGPMECVVCYRLSDGVTAWVHADPVSFTSGFGGSGPRATPTIFAGHVYTVGATGILNCLDGASGKTIWNVDILKDNSAQNIAHGVCGSPLIVDGRVIVCPTGGNGISLAAYDCETGKRVWHGGTQQASYGSPLLTDLAGMGQILLFNAVGVAGHNSITGEVLWSFPWSNSESTNCSQPLANVGAPGQVFISTGYGTGCAMLLVDSAGKPPVKLWSNRYMRTKFTTPIFHDGYIYGLDEGILESMDATSGEKRRKGGRYGHGQILLAGDLLIVQAEDGEVVLVEANPQLKELGRFPALSGKTWNNLALAGKYLLVRNDHEAACLELAMEVQVSRLPR